MLALLREHVKHSETIPRPRVLGIGAIRLDALEHVRLVDEIAEDAIAGVCREYLHCDVFRRECVTCVWISQPPQVSRIVELEAVPMETNLCVRASHTVEFCPHPSFLTISSFPSWTDCPSVSGK
jgi:hypothetical protein